MHKKGLPLEFVNLNAEVLARGQYATASSSDRPSWSRFSVVSLRSRANAESVPETHIVLHASLTANSLVLIHCSQGWDGRQIYNTAMTHDALIIWMQYTKIRIILWDLSQDGTERFQNCCNRRWAATTTRTEPRYNPRGMWTQWRWQKSSPEIGDWSSNLQQSLSWLSYLSSVK